MTSIGSPIGTPSEAENGQRFMELITEQQRVLERNQLLTLLATNFATAFATAHAVRETEVPPEPLARRAFAFAEAFLAERAKHLQEMPDMDALTKFSKKGE